MPIQLSSVTGYLSRIQQNSISMIITMITPKEGNVSSPFFCREPLILAVWGQRLEETSQALSDTI